MKTCENYQENKASLVINCVDYLGKIHLNFPSSGCNFSFHRLFAQSTVNQFENSSLYMWINYMPNKLPFACEKYAKKAAEKRKNSIRQKLLHAISEHCSSFIVLVKNFHFNAE